MKCHYSYDKKAGKFWYPQCWGGAIYGEHMCTCEDWPSSFEGFERKEYNIMLKEKNQQLKESMREIAVLNRIIRKLTNG